MVSLLEQQSGSRCSIPFFCQSFQIIFRNLDFSSSPPKMTSTPFLTRVQISARLSPKYWATRAYSLDKGLPNTPTSSVCNESRLALSLQSEQSIDGAKTHAQNHDSLLNLPPLPKVTANHQHNASHITAPNLREHLLALKPTADHACMHVATQTQLQPNPNPLDNLPSHPLTHADDMPDPVWSPAKERV